MTSPEDAVAEFLKEGGSGGALQRKRCCTCQLPNIEAVNAAVRYFSQLRTSGETTQTWKDFHRGCLVPRFNYPLSVDALRDHTRGCLELN